MKKDLIKLGLAVLTIVCLVIVVDFVYGRTINFISQKLSSQYPNAFRIAQAMEKVEDEVVVLGASTASCHYDPRILSDSLSMSVYNCGMNGQNFLFFSVFIDQIMSRYSPKMLILDIDPRMLTEGNNTFERLNALNNYYFSNELCSELLNKNGKYEGLKLRSNLYRNRQQLHSIVTGIALKEQNINGYTPIRPPKHIFPSHTTLNYQTESAIDTLAERLLVNSIKHCKAKQTEFVLVFSPRLRSTNIRETNGYKKILVIANEFNIPFIDLGEDRFLCKPKLFKDGSHLNSEGAEIFSQEIAHRIKELKYSN